MASPVQLWPLVSAVVAVGSQPTVAAYGPMVGGFISNPATARDQNLAVIETLFINLIMPAMGAMETATTFPIQPGETFKIPAGFSGNVSVTAASSGHRFTGVIFHPTPNFTPSTGAFPPAGNTVLTQTINSYLYQQYNDDDNLQAFVDSYNALTQGYVDWFATANLPVYTQLTGGMLDWIAQGLYGISRPTLPSGSSQDIGPLNTWAYNTIPYNTIERIGPTNYYLTNDDIFKRIITWHMWKGDGKTFDIRWLKRRIIRFLTGTDGGPGNTDQTYPVSITFGADSQVNINFLSIRRRATGGALYGVSNWNTFYYNEIETTSISVPISPLVPVFKAAVDAGVLELPFQFTYIVNVN